MNKIKGYIGIVLFLVVIAGIYFWESYGREELLYSNVYVASQDLHHGTPLTADKLSLVKMEQERLIKGSYSSASEIQKIIGYEAKHFIPANSQITYDSFDIPEIVLDENEYICGIPSDWIKAFPQSIRRKDKIAMFAVTSTKDETLDSDLNIEEIKELIQGKKPLFFSTIVYVKDGSNREVVDIVESGHRMDASSKVNSIELVMNPDDFEIMNKLFVAGYKFVIMYQ